MKNDTLSKLFLSLVVVFSSTAAFTEETTWWNIAELTILIGNIESIQSREEGKRSRENIKKASEALERLSQYSDLSQHSEERVIKALTRAVEYELKPHLHKSIDGWNFSFKSYKKYKSEDILRAAIKSLFEVLSHHEEKNHPEFEKWITNFIKKVKYSAIADFSEDFLFRREAWNHLHFPKWIKIYIERVEKEGKDHYDRFVKGFDERRRAVSIFQVLKDHPFFEHLLAQHTEKTLRGVERLKDNGHGFFKPSGLLNKKNKELERVDFYNEVFYRTLQEAIKSGEYDKAYTDYIKEFKGNNTSATEITYLNKFIKRIRSTKKSDRSTENLEKASEALKSLGQYSGERVIKALTGAIEYESKVFYSGIKIGPYYPPWFVFHYDGEYRDYHRSGNKGVLAAAIKSLFQVISHHEQRKQEFDKWITSFIRKANYDTIGGFVEGFLIQREAWNHLDFPKWIKLYVERRSKGTNKNKYDVNLLTADAAILEALTQHPFFKRLLLIQHVEEKIKTAQSLKVHRASFGNFIEFKEKGGPIRNKKSREYEAERLYNRIVYQTLQDIIKSGEYDKAYTDYINNMSVEKAMQKFMGLDTANQRRAKAKSSCRELF